jgi:hypothetical protein
MRNVLKDKLDSHEKNLCTYHTSWSVSFFLPSLSNDLLLDSCCDGITLRTQQGYSKKNLASDHNLINKIQKTTRLTDIRE